MKFRITLSGKTAYNVMRECGYATERFDETTGEFRFYRSLAGTPYPKFHLYCIVSDNAATLNLHLDQRKPSYKGSHAHSGEYEGKLVEQEASRIQHITSV